MAANGDPSKNAETGYKCTFIEDVPELFKCNICRWVLRDPQITECCGKNACRPCIAKIAKENRPCPIPGCARPTPSVRINFNRDLHFDILKSTVYCTRREAGCEWMGRLEHLDGHLKECPFAEEECRNLCGLYVQRRLVEAHEAICERLAVKCHQCGVGYERREHLDHIAVCPFTKVKCPFNIVGCTSEVLNKDLQEHFDQSLAKHYALVSKQSRDVSAEVEGSKLMAEVEEKLAPWRREVKSFIDDISANEAEIAELQVAFEEAQREFKELKRKHGQILLEKQSLVLEREKSLRVICEDEEKAFLEAKVKCFGPALPRIHPNDITSRPASCPATTQEYTPRVSFTIPDFATHRKNDALMCLPPFYSHNGGYRMCLVVYCNGYRMVKSNSLSVLVSLMKGKYDEHLLWPLKCNVTVEIHGVSLQNIRKTIEVKSAQPLVEDECPAVQNKYGGCDNFLRLNNIRPSYYLSADGCLKIDVCSVY